MKKLIENFWLKIFALSIGLFLWFHVATEKIYTYELQLPITDIILKDNLTLSEQPPESLTVTVSASGKQLLRKKWRDRGLKIIANQFDIGRHNLPLTTLNTSFQLSAGDVTLEEINLPTNIIVAVDRIKKVTLPIEADLDINSDDGFAVNSVVLLNPTSVNLTGPEKIINRIKAIFTEKKQLNGLRNNLNISIPLALPSGYNLNLSPDSVNIGIEVVPVKTRLIENIPVIVFNLPPEQTVVLEPSFISVELTGPPNEIDLLNRSILVASVDYNSLNENLKTNLKIDCPAKFKIKTVSSDSVQVTLQ